MEARLGPTQGRRSQDHQEEANRNTQLPYWTENVGLRNQLNGKMQPQNPRNQQDQRAVHED